MLDDNGKYSVLSLDGAQVIILEDAVTAGITVTSGSVEQQLTDLFSQAFLTFDTDLGNSYNIQFNPTGSDIDLQNPGIPRLQAQEASGYVYCVNGTGDPITIPLNTIISAPNSNQYTTGNNTVIVPAMGNNTIGVISVEKGIAQNLPSSQTFTNSLDLTITNPQPFTNGRDLESDTGYTNRIIYLKTNNASQQATAEAKNEMLVYYQDSEFYVNNTANTLPLPVPVPPNGYICVVQFPSSTLANQDETAQAFRILANRFEFGNAYRTSTDTHPVFSSVIYTGSFPEVFFLIPAQAVESTMVAEVTVRFAPNVDSSEKLILANAFGQFFAQNIVNFFGGAQGQSEVIFQEADSPPTYPISTQVNILASNGLIEHIGPAFSIEQLRALASDANQIPQLPNMEYLGMESFTFEMTTGIMGEPDYTLSIAGPLYDADFKVNMLFNDGSSWYDRYVYIDPALISITVTEVPF